MKAKYIETNATSRTFNSAHLNKQHAAMLHSTAVKLLSHINDYNFHNYYDCISLVKSLCMCLSNVTGWRNEPAN